MSRKRILSVGQCWADHSALTRTIEPKFQAEVVAAATADDAIEQLRVGDFTLVLVNRVFDADGDSGVGFIRRLKETAAVPVMLVSNYEDAQRDAEAAGAVPGFGKAAMGQPQMLARLRPFLSPT